MSNILLITARRKKTINMPVITLIRHKLKNEQIGKPFLLSLLKYFSLAFREFVRVPNL